MNEKKKRKKETEVEEEHRQEQDIEMQEASAVTPSTIRSAVQNSYQLFCFPGRERREGGRGREVGVREWEKIGG